MYEEFYGLKEKPFNLTPDPRFLFLSENHRGAFEHLLYGIREKEGFILITGEVGTGKTTLCRALLDKIEDKATDTALILNPMFSEQELLQCILSDFGVPCGGTSKKVLLDTLNQFLLRQQSANRKSILIIDEAQNLPLPVLEETRILSNLETEKEKLLQIVLMGQLELKERLSLPRLRQLNQRISIRYNLRPLAKEEVPRYIHHRLTVAGSPGDIEFASGAMREIYRYSRGIPRLVNLASDRALLAGFAAQSREIGKSTVMQGLKSLEGGESSPSNESLRQKTVLGVAGLLLFVLGLAVAVLFLEPERAFLQNIWNSSVSRSPSDVADGSKGAGKDRFYTVQLGSFPTETEAMEVARRVKATGYPLFMAKADAMDGSDRHRLYIGKFTLKTRAEEVARTFEKADGFSKIKVVLTSSPFPQQKSP